MPLAIITRPSESRFHRIINILLILAGATAFCYVLARAWLLDLTYDEGWTLAQFTSQSIRSIFLCSPCDANNHILNTILIKIFTILLYNSLFVARLPNVLALLLYLIFAYKIVVRLEPVPRIVIFLLLICNPFLLDFFGLARGYGLSLAFVTGSVHFAFKYHENTKLRSAVISIVLAALAVLSNFTALYFFMALGLAIAAIHLTRWKRGTPEVLFLELAIASILAAIIITPVRKLVDNDLLYYGGKEGFYQDTLLSLARYTYGHPFESVDVSLYLNFFLILFLLIICIGVADWIKDIEALLSSKKTFALALLALPALISIFFVHFLDNLYLIDRTALFLYPLLVISSGIWSSDIRARWAKFCSYFAVSAMTLLMLINLLPNLNLYKTITWPHDSRTRDILTFIEQQHERGKTVKIDASWPLERSILYHIKEEVYQNLQFIGEGRNNLSGEADYLLFFDRPLSRVGYFPSRHPVLGYSRDTLLTFPHEGIYLFANLKPLEGSQE